MSRVEEILVKRDGVSLETAKEMIESCKSELWDSVYGTNITDPAEVIMMELGLEPDYIMDVLEA